MSLKTRITDWFNKWESGDFLNLPLAEDFSHTSPFGTITGKEAYLDLVKANREKFLGHTFEIHDILEGDNAACVRYTSKQADGYSMDVSEWHYFKDGKIQKIHAYYHIGEIREDRQLSRH
ncbi:MAG: nuclear transport factor 2 family protein [Bacteroidetes bacterium]|nr:nuclear transport factor 2 family protein [Bacteroidota bacterium]